MGIASQLECSYSQTKYGKVCLLEKTGDPTYLFIHGLAGHKGVFEQLFFENIPRDSGLICLDLLGHGDSDRLPDELEYTFAIQSMAIRELLSKRGINEVNLVLHSMASALLPYFLGFEDLRLAAIYLIEGNLTIGDAKWSTQISEMSDGEFDTFVYRFGKYAPLILDKELNQRFDRGNLSDWSSGFVKVDPRALRGLAREVSSDSISGKILDSLGTVNERTFYLRSSGQNSGMKTELLEKLGIKVFSISGTGHYIMIDKPQEVAKAIFLTP